MTLQKRWIEGERWKELEQVLAFPVMQDAFAIIQEMAKPNSAANARAIEGLPAKDAAFRLSCVLNVQSGIQDAIDKLRALAKPFNPPAKTEPLVPYGHITADNFEERLNPKPE